MLLMNSWLVEDLHEYLVHYDDFAVVATVVLDEKELYTVVVETEEHNDFD